jgi:hypothetical protein
VSRRDRCPEAAIGKGEFEMIVGRRMGQLRAAVVLAAGLFGHAAAMAQERTPQDFCDAFAGAMRASCLESADLLMGEPALPEAALAVRLTANEGGLIFAYTAIDPSDGLEAAEPACEAAGLVLPAEGRARLTATSHDTIYTWRVPDRGIAIDLVPGRINEIFIEPEAAGSFAGSLEDAGGRPIGDAGLRFAEGLVDEAGAVDLAALCEAAAGDGPQL